MLVDSHCHLDMLDLQPFEGGLAGVLAAARELDVTHMLCVSINLESYPAMVDLLGDWPGVSISAGVHPSERDGREPDEQTLLELARDPRNVAIGETGLDYHWNDGDLGWQRERFRCHVRAARAAGKPLIVHTREARADTLRILREERAEDVGGVLHCFTEDWSMAREAIELGFYISISGIVTFHQAQNVRDMAVQVPLERLLIETDAPWLSPAPFRGKTNHPGRVRLVAEKLAEIRGESLAELARETYTNANNLFGLN